MRLPGWQMDISSKEWPRMDFCTWINSGPAALDGTGDQKDDAGNPTMKPFWEITDEEMNASLMNTSWHPSITEYFPGGG